MRVEHGRATCWLAIDDLDEEALRWLMKFLAAEGQVVAAIKQYEASRLQLWQEMEVPFQPATVGLANQLMALHCRLRRGRGFNGRRLWKHRRSGRKRVNCPTHNDFLRARDNLAKLSTLLIKRFEIFPEVSLTETFLGSNFREV